MKLSITDLPHVSDFNYVACEYGGRKCIWFYPHIEGVAWNEQNIIFRSSIWTADTYELVSPGLKKFFNWDQQVDLHPAPTDLSRVSIMEKLDGSCLIVSKFNKELIVRTRRANASAMLNGQEIEYLKIKYPLAFDNVYLNEEAYSLVYEWLSPENRIVLKHDESDLRLLAIINHEDYSYFTQDETDEIAKVLGVPRPRRFKFDSILDMLAKGEALTNEEGYVCYYGRDQKLRKIKSDWYVAVHNVRNGLTLKNVIELYFAAGTPTYDEYMALALEQYKIEGMTEAMPLISTVLDGMKTVRQIEAGMKRFVENLSTCNNRKEQAQQIIKSYGDTARTGMVFTLLDNNKLQPKEYKKLLYQVLAK